MTALLYNLDFCIARYIASMGSSSKHTDHECTLPRRSVRSKQSKPTHAKRTPPHIASRQTERTKLQIAREKEDKKRAKEMKRARCAKSENVASPHSDAFQESMKNDYEAWAKYHEKVTEMQQEEFDLDPKSGLPHDTKREADEDYQRVHWDDSDDAYSDNAYSDDETQSRPTDEEISHWNDNYMETWTELWEVPEHLRDHVD